MRNILIDNATLKSVQRIMGDLPLSSLDTIDGDILAFENYLLAILFYDEIVTLNDFESIKLNDKISYFGNIKFQELDNSLKKELDDAADKITKKVVPYLEYDVKQSCVDLKPFFDQLRLNTSRKYKLHTKYAGLKMDSAGNYYYERENPGASSIGTILEMLKTASKVELRKYGRIASLIRKEIVSPEDDEIFFQINKSNIEKNKVAHLFNEELTDQWFENYKNKEGNNFLLRTDFPEPHETIKRKKQRKKTAKEKLFYMMKNYLTIF